MPSWRSVLDALRIRVAIRVIGEVQPDKLKKYLAALDQHKVMELVDIRDNGISGVFAKQLGANGEIYYEFVQAENLSNDLCDFDDFQLYRRIHATIGVGLVETMEMPQEYEKFISSAREGRSESHIVRCFLFGNAIFPPGTAKTEIAIIPDADEKTMDGYIVTLMQELTVSIFRSFEATIADYSNRIIIDSPRGQDSLLAKDQVHRLKMRTPGRISKIIGDLYLLGGAYTDAVNTLVSAAEDTKVNGDLLWNAGAQEALQLSLVLQSEIALADKRDAVTLLWIALPDKLREVAPLYQKADMTLLAFEVHRSIAALLNYGGSSAEAAMALCYGWAIHRNLSWSDKLYALTIIIDQFNLLGMRRKGAFFLQALAVLLANQREEAMALAVLEKTFPVYGVQLRRPLNLNDKKIDQNWPTLRLAIIRRAAILGESHQDQSLMIEYYCALLGYARNQLDNEEQLKISKALKKRIHLNQHSVIPDCNGTSLPCLLPLLDAITIDKDAPELWRKVDNKGLNGQNGSNDDCFIYTPFPKDGAIAEKVPEIVSLAVHDTLLVTLKMSNPYSFPIELIGLCLVSSGEGEVEISVEEIALTLPAWTKSKEVCIMCSPKSPGELIIKGVMATIFGIQMSITPTFGTILKIPVIPQQPILQIPDRLGSSPSLALIEGEVVNSRITLYNFGMVPAKAISVKIENEWEEGNFCNPPSIDGILFGQTDPTPVSLIGGAGDIPVIDPGTSIDLTVEIIGILGWRASKIIFTCYSTSFPPLDDGDNFEVYYSRRLEYNIHGTVRPGLCVLRVSALSYQHIPKSTNDADDWFKDLDEEEEEKRGREGEGGGVEEKENAREGKGENGLIQIKENFAGSTSFLPLVKGRERLVAEEYFLLVLDIDNKCKESFVSSVFVEGGRVRIQKSLTKRLVLPVKRIHQPTPKDIPLSKGQLSALSKIFKTENQTNQIIDRAWYWTKAELLKKLSLTWNCEPSRFGKLDVSMATLDGSFLPFICKRETIISVDMMAPMDMAGVYVWPIEKVLNMTINVSSSSLQPSSLEASSLPYPGVRESFVVRALPALHIADDEFGIEFDDMLCINGCLQGIYEAPDYDEDGSFKHKFGIFATSPCRIKLLVHVERRSDRSVHSHYNPVSIDFKLVQS